MLIPRNLKPRDNNALSRLRLWRVRPAIFILFLACFMAGCGGGNKTANTTVAQVLVTPTTVSLVAGQVLQVSASAVNSANNNVATTFTFNSSNVAVATVSPRGEICGGVWDSLFVVCNGNDASNNPISGTATITVTAGNVTSGPITVAVHPSVTSVTVDPLPAGSCLSNGQTHQFVAHAFHNGSEITNQVGNFSWSTSDPTVVTVDANGVSTARVGGLAGIVANIGATTSPAASFKTCMPAFIALHLAGDVGTPTTSVTLNVGDTKTLLADMIDEKGVFTTPAPITVFSDNTLVATNAGGTITAQAPGGAGFVAACVPPTCGNGLNTPIYSNLFTVTVNGTSSNATTVYAASSFLPPVNATIPLVPIDISKSPPAVGTAIPLPGTPNSIVFDRTGARAYIGTAVGLAVLDPGSNTVSVAAPKALGKVLAVSPDGNKVIVSNAANNPSTGTPIEPTTANQRVWVFDRTANTLTTFVASGAVAATYDDDGFRAYIVTSNGNLYVFSPLQTFLTTTLGSPATDAVTLPSGSFAYAATPAGVKTIATCNNTVVASPPTNSTNIQLVSRVPNTNTIYAADSTGVDVISVSVSPVTPPVSITPATCAPNVSYSNLFIDFGAGPLTAHQILIGTNGVHSALLPAGVNKVFTVLNGNAAGVATLAAGATEPLGGGMTTDGNFLWLGIGGTNSVDRVNLENNTDDIQVPMSFKKGDGSPAPPDLVAIRPK